MISYYDIIYDFARPKKNFRDSQKKLKKDIIQDIIY